MSDDEDISSSGESVTVMGKTRLVPFPVLDPADEAISKDWTTCKVRNMFGSQPTDQSTLSDAGSETTIVAQDAKPSPGEINQEDCSTHEKPSLFYDEPPHRLPTLKPYCRQVLSRPPTWEELPNNMKLILMRELTTWFTYRTSIAALRLTNGEELAFRRLYNTELQKTKHFNSSMCGYTPEDEALLKMACRAAVISYETDTISMQDFDKAWSFLEGIGLDARTFDLAHWTSHAGVDRFRIVSAEKDPSLIASGHKCQLTNSSYAHRPRPSRRVPVVHQLNYGKQRQFSSLHQSQPPTAMPALQSFGQNLRVPLELEYLQLTS